MSTLLESHRSFYFGAPQGVHQRYLFFQLYNIWWDAKGFLNSGRVSKGINKNKNKNFQIRNIPQVNESCLFLCAICFSTSNNGFGLIDCSIITCCHVRKRNKKEYLTWWGIPHHPYFISSLYYISGYVCRWWLLHVLLRSLHEYHATSLILMGAPCVLR